MLLLAQRLNGRALVSFEEGLKLEQFGLGVHRFVQALASRAFV